MSNSKLMKKSLVIVNLEFILTVMFKTFELTIRVCNMLYVLYFSVRCMKIWQAYRFSFGNPWIVSNKTIFLIFLVFFLGHFSLTVK